MIAHETVGEHGNPRIRKILLHQGQIIVAVGSGEKHLLAVDAALSDMVCEAGFDGSEVAGHSGEMVQEGCEISQEMKWRRSGRDLLDDFRKEADQADSF